MPEHSVADRDRTLEFDGVLLAHESSAKPGKARWFEVWIYRTGGGRWIVAGAGMSTVGGEDDRRWAQVCDEPTAVIERLRLYDEDGGAYVPRTSLDALRKAAQLDQQIKEAYEVESVDRIA